MTKLYIQIKDGSPVNHPVYTSNLLQAFGTIPSNWEPFVRVEKPDVGIYEIVEGDKPTYEKVNGVWTDVWFVRAMTQAEKLAKQQTVKDFWAQRPYASNWSAWTFDENLCDYVPPIPRPEPEEGKRIAWCGAENNWKEVPPLPVDGKPYIFNYYEWKWIEAPNV